MKKGFVWGLGLELAAASLAVAAPASAQKAQDTARIAINDPFVVLSPYYVPVDEAGNFFRKVYGTLIRTNEHTQKFVPDLAKSWTRVNETTLDFDLRDDVTFHNGDHFSADDIVSTVEFAMDPKYVFQFKTRFTWVKSVEKLGPYKVRIQSNAPNAMDLGLLSYIFMVQDKKAFDALPDKGDYGRLTPYGTGPYKVVSMDKNNGIVVERFNDFKGDPAYNRAPIKTVHGIPIPDRQTQIAQLITGGVDLLRNVPPDMAAALASNPNVEVSNLPTGSFIYFGQDAAGRSEQKAFQDPRVRKAIVMAIDRDGLIKNIVPGGAAGIAEKMKTICFDTNTGCKVSTPFPNYDPDGAKKLMAEAGYANGFEATYDCFIPIKDVCEAISGYLLKIGVKASVVPTTINVFRQHQGDGTQQLFSVFYPTSVFPDAGNILDVFFGGERDYARDDQITDGLKAGLAEFDPAKRADIYEKVLNRNNEMNYVLAVSSLPTVYVHSKDIEIKPSLTSAGDYHISDYFWK